MTTSRSEDACCRNVCRNRIIENKEDVRLIMLDTNNDEHECSVRIRSKLLELNPAALFCNNFNDCVKLIKMIRNEQIFLIVLGDFTRMLRDQVRHFRSIVSIFIYCFDQKDISILMSEDDRIIEIFDEEQALLETVHSRICVIEQQSLAFTIFDQKQKSLRNLSKESASFIWHQLLIDVLTKMSNNEQSKRDMLDKCADYYRANQRESKKIDEFEKTYIPEKAIEWYTDDCFIHKLLNKALRTEDIDLLYAFRAFIIDLCQQIECKKMKLEPGSTLTLYRGQQLSTEELEKLRQNIDMLISMNGFLSTSRDREVALMFAGCYSISNMVQSVLFEIEVKSSLKSVIFADIADKSHIGDEQEVLFNMNTIFRIVSVSFDSTIQMWKVGLMATDEGLDKISEYNRALQSQMVEYSPMISFGRLLLVELGQKDRARDYFNMILTSLPPNHPDLSAVYNGLAHVQYVRGELNAALENFQFAYNIRREQLSPFHSHIANSLKNIGNVYREKGNFERALECYEEALTIDNKNFTADHIQRARTIQNIGELYRHKKEFDTAINYLSRGLEMYYRILPAQHPEIVTCLGCIGMAHMDKGELDTALDYFHRQLQMAENCMPPDHPDIYRHIYMIAHTYRKMNLIQKALDFCQEKLNVRKNLLDKTHVEVARILMLIAIISQDKDPHEALKYNQEALSILEDLEAPNHHAITECLIVMSDSYGKLNIHNDALQCNLKTVDIYREILISDCIGLAKSLWKLGSTYFTMNKSSEAMQCLKESQRIYKDYYEANHDVLKQLEADINLLNENSMQ